MTGEALVVGAIRVSDSIESTSLSIVRPWIGVPLDDGRLELDGELRSPLRIVSFVLRCSGSESFPIEAIDRSRAARVDVSDDNLHAYGFDGEFFFSSLSAKDEITLVAIDDGGGAIEVARVAVAAPRVDVRTEARLAPDFLIVGAMKAGTTSIYDALTRHPRVLHRQPKEIHYFDLRYSRGSDYYRSCFLPKLAYAPHLGMLAGDATPGYLSPYHPECAARAYEFAPEARIIASLRDPTARAISHYHHNRLTLGQAMPPIEEAFSDEALGPGGAGEDYVQYGRYSATLVPWFEHFPRDRILLIRFEEFEHRPHEVLAELCTFLGLTPSPRATFPRSFQNVYPPAPDEVVRRLDDFFASERAAIAARFGPRFDFDAHL